MRVIATSVAALLCLTSCGDSETNATTSPQSQVRVAVPQIHVENATGKAHRVDVDYDRGHKTLRIAGGDRFDFDRTGPSSRAGNDAAGTYDIAVYEYLDPNEKCSTTLDMVGGDFGNDSRCRITSLAAGKCRVQAAAVGTTCRVDVRIAD